jgi:hypothetical protein
MRLVAEMVGQLDLERALHQPLGQPREHATRSDDLLLAARAGEQLVDDSVRQPALEILRHALQTGSQLGPNEPDLSARRFQNRLADRGFFLGCRHGDPFRSCPHTSCDRPQKPAAHC